MVISRFHAIMDFTRTYNKFSRYSSGGTDDAIREITMQAICCHAGVIAINTLMTQTTNGHRYTDIM